MSPNYLFAIYTRVVNTMLLGCRDHQNDRDLRKMRGQQEWKGRAGGVRKWSWMRSMELNIHCVSWSQRKWSYGEAAEEWHGLWLITGSITRDTLLRWPTELLRETAGRVLQAGTKESIRVPLATTFQRRKRCPNDHFYVQCLIRRGRCVSPHSSVRKLLEEGK